MIEQSTDNKKNILITVSSLGNGGGISRYILSLCKILKDQYKIIVLTTHDKPHSVWGAEQLKAISKDIRLISISQQNKLLKYLNVIKIIRHERPDYIINNYNGLIQFILPYIKKSAKFIHILHNDTEDFYRIGNINSKLIDAWIAPTYGIAEKFNEYTNDIHKSKVSVISHGVDEAQANNIINNEKLEIVFTGVLYEHKGVKELPLIVHRLHEKNIDFHFTVIGTGILENWLKKEFKEDISNGNVTFTGVIDHKLVYEHMARANIFLYPTHIDAFGLVIAEAMINGAVPIVTFLKGVTDNLIEDGTSGFLIKKGDIEGFVSAICSLANDSLLLKRTSNNAKQKAKSQLSMDHMKYAYIKFLQKI